MMFLANRYFLEAFKALDIEILVSLISTGVSFMLQASNKSCMLV
jgi:hypothetical protein